MSRSNGDMYLSICFFIVLSWPFVGAEQGKMKLLLLKYILEVGMKRSVGKHVLMLLENNPYPQDTRVSREVRALTSAGYQVSVISPAQHGQPWRELLDSVCVYRFPLPLL